MKNRNHRKVKGLSIVVTTLILLVVAILLTAVVSYYATNVTRTRTMIEDVRISKPRVWVNDTGAVAAFKVHNIGGKDILIDGILVRSIETEWNDVYYYRVPLGVAFNSELNRTSFQSLVGSSVTIDGLIFNQSTSKIPLISSGVILVYVKGPGNLSIEDVGTTVSVSVCSVNAQYINECNVKSGTSQ